MLVVLYNILEEAINFNVYRHILRNFKLLIELRRWPSVKLLPHKLEELSSDPKDSCKSWVGMIP